MVSQYRWKVYPIRFQKLKKLGLAFINGLIKNIFKEVEDNLKVKITLVGPKTVNSKI